MNRRVLAALLAYVDSCDAGKTFVSDRLGEVLERLSPADDVLFEQLTTSLDASEVEPDIEGASLLRRAREPSRVRMQGFCFVDAGIELRMPEGHVLTRDQAEKLREYIRLNSNDGDDQPSSMKVLAQAAKRLADYGIKLDKEALRQGLGLDISSLERSIGEAKSDDDPPPEAA